MPDDTLRKEHWFSRLCNHALLWIACVVCGVILLLNILYRVWIDQSSALCNVFTNHSNQSVISIEPFCACSNAS